MSESNINTLPSEILSQIFKFLISQSDLETLFSLSLVSKRFYFILEGNGTFCLSTWKEFSLENYWNLNDNDKPNNISYKTWYLEKRSKNSCINSAWINNHLLSFCDQNPIYKNFQGGVYLKMFHQEYSKPGLLHLVEEDCSDTYHQFIYAGFDNDKCNFPPNISATVALLTIPVEFPCPRCHDRGEKSLIYYMIRSGTWKENDLEYRCEKCKGYLWFYISD